MLFIFPQLAGILAPYNGECNLVPGPDPIELTTWDQFVSVYMYMYMT